MNGLLKSALHLASCGLPVHPCRPGRKKPILKAWQHRATTDRATLRRWWSQWPDANVAVATGGAERLLVVDVDPEAGGKVRLGDHGKHVLPPTVVVRTTRGGFHFWLTVPAGRPLPGNTAGRLGPGVDTRGEGGFVLTPPSVSAGRRYRWSVKSEDVVATAPTWLLDRLENWGNGEAATDPAEWFEMVTSGIDRGKRNSSVARIAGLLLRFLPAAHAETVAALVGCFNSQCCRPPLDPEELKRTLDSIASRELRRRGLSS
jgi:hypothetical protein